MKKLLKKITFIVSTISLITLSSISYAEDQIRIVGSSTVFPFSTAVAEEFGRSTKFKTPIVESTGSGGGMKLFCSGIGFEYPDITNASRRIKQNEYNTCSENGIRIIEVKVGYDGIVLANSKKGSLYNLTTRDIYLALAKEIPVNDLSLIHI